MSKRTDMLASSFMRTVGAIIQNNIKDPRLGFTTITEVEVSGDSRYVTIYVSVMGDYDVRKESLQVLERSTGFIKSQARKTIKMRFMPELIFKLDETNRKVDKIENLLKEIKKDKDS